MTDQQIAARPLPTQARLRELFTYDPDSGEFTRRIDAGKFRAGEIAGCIVKSTGYVLIGVDGAQYYAHRLAWLYVTGEWPDPQCDHENRVRHDNRWKNLRPATIAEQRQNQGLRKDSKSGFKGVSWMAKRERWRARITVGGVTHTVGQAFLTAEDAAAAYVEAKARLHTFQPQMTA